MSCSYISAQQCTKILDPHPVLYTYMIVVIVVGKLLLTPHESIVQLLGAYHSYLGQGNQRYIQGTALNFVHVAYAWRLT